MAKVAVTSLDFRFPNKEFEVEVRAHLSKSGNTLAVDKNSMEFINFLKDKFHLMKDVEAEKLFNPENDQVMCFHFSANNALAHSLWIRKKASSLKLRIIPGKTFQENKRKSESAVKSEPSVITTCS